MVLVAQVQVVPGEEPNRKVELKCKLGAMVLMVKDETLLLVQVVLGEEVEEGKMDLQFKP